MFLRPFILSALFVFSVLAFGDSLSIGRCDCTVSPFRDFRDLLIPIVEFTDSPTHRQTTEEYATTHHLEKKDVDDAVAATGELNCNGWKSSANLVSLDGRGKSDVIAAAGHANWDQKTCRQIADATECKFISPPNAKPVKVARLIKSGFKCPVNGEDWSAMRLETAIDGIRPYKLPETKRTTLKYGQKIISVGAHSEDFWREDPKTKKKIFPKHLQDCGIRIIYYKYDPPAVTDRCDGSFGKSGGAMISDLNSRELLAVSSGFSVKKEPQRTASEREFITHIPVRGEYDEASFSEGSTAVSGKFLEALRDALK